MARSLPGWVYRLRPRNTLIRPWRKITGPSSGACERAREARTAPERLVCRACFEDLEQLPPEFLRPKQPARMAARKLDERRAELRSQRLSASVRRALVA